MTGVSAALRMALGGAIWGSFLGIFSGGVLGALIGGLFGDVSIGLDLAIFAGCAGCLGGALFGVSFAARQPATGTPPEVDAGRPPPGPSDIATPATPTVANVRDHPPSPPPERSRLEASATLEE
jgi:hypothetical protein